VLPSPYCDFFSGSCVALGGVEGELLPGALAPPEAEPEPGFDGSDELGVLGAVLEAPPEGELLEDELAPELDGGVDGVVALLLELPLLPVVLPVPLSCPQAARPKARATAAANIESFMFPPWL
jgi:hypothetical protein